MSVAEPKIKRMTSYDNIEEAFPKLDAGLIPCGSRVLVQVRSPKDFTKGGVYVGTKDLKETELWNCQVAKVIAMGPGVFRNRDTLELWPEGDWCQIGDFIRVPKYGGDRWVVEDPKTGRTVLFALIKDLDVIGKIMCNPLDVIAFL